MIPPLAVAFAALVSSCGTSWVLRRAGRLGLIDVPNARSSHQQPTPRGGGLGVVIALVGATALLGIAGAVSASWLALVGIAGGLVAVTGWIDDRRSLPAGVRLAAHLAAAALALALLDPRPSTLGSSVAGGLVWLALVGVGIAWHCNLFNFMDGIDGLAGAHALFVGLSGALLLALYTDRRDLAWLLACLAVAVAGFLRWNWPPARIFLGDVGSGFLGFVLALAAVASAGAAPLSLWSWLILGGTFVVDATVTLLRRATAGERLTSAHRSHAYQHLARRWASHRRATLTYLELDIAVALPLAWLSVSRPRWAPWLCIGCYAGLALLFLTWGAGGRETGAEGGLAHDARRSA